MSALCIRNSCIKRVHSYPPRGFDADIRFRATAARISALNVLVDFLALMEVDGAADVAFEAGVEQLQGPRATRPWRRSASRRSCRSRRCRSCRRGTRPERRATSTPRPPRGPPALIRARTSESVLPRQSPSSSILASISREGDLPAAVALVFIFASASGRRMRSPLHSRAIGARRHLRSPFDHLIL